MRLPTLLAPSAVFGLPLLIGACNSAGKADSADTADSTVSDSDSGPLDTADTDTSDTDRDTGDGDPPSDPGHPTADCIESGLGTDGDTLVHTYDDGEDKVSSVYVNSASANANWSF